MIALGRVASRWRADKEVAPEEGFEPPTQRLTAACSTTELLRNVPGGADRIRTGVHGFAGRCVTTPPPRRYPAEPDPAQPRTTRSVATIVSTPGRVNGGRHRHVFRNVHPGEELPAAILPPCAMIGIVVAVAENARSARK